MNLCPALAPAAGTAGWALGHLPRVPLGCLPCRKWGLDFGAGNLSTGWFPSNCLAGLAGAEFPSALWAWGPRVASPGISGPWPTPYPASPSVSESGCSDTQPQVPLLTCHLPLPGTSQWPRPGAPGALSPSYDGGLHSLVSFLPQPSGAGWGLSLVGACGQAGEGVPPHGSARGGGHGTRGYKTHGDPGGGEVAWESGSACLLWPVYSTWKPWPLRATRPP